MTRSRVGGIAGLVAWALVLSTVGFGTVAAAGSGDPPPTDDIAQSSSTLTWNRLPGMVEAFAGSRVSMVERGADGFLALGRSQASGMPRAWRSTDGLAWERLPLPPTTFGGGEPQELVWGPSGWVALGWDVTLRHGVRHQVWVSSDGETWAPTSHPSGLLKSRRVGYISPGDHWRVPWRTLVRVGDSVFITEEDGSVPLRVSQDGHEWRATDRIPATDVETPPGTDTIDGELIPGPRGYLFDDWPSSIWASKDGRTWTQAPYPGDVGRLEFFGWEGGWIAHAQERIGDGIWYSADGSEWTAGAITDAVLAELSYLRPVSLDGSRLVVVQGLAYPGVVSDAWIGTFGSPAEPPRVTMTGQEPTDPATDPNIVPMVRPRGLDCPDKPRTIRRLLRIATWKAAVCYGDQSIRVVGPAFRTTEAPGSSGTAYDDALFVEGSSWGIGPILAPPSRLDRRYGARDYIVVGHFDDPSCDHDPTGSPTPAAALLGCRQQFVPTRIRRVGR